LRCRPTGAQASAAGCLAALQKRPCSIAKIRSYCFAPL